MGYLDKIDFVLEAGARLFPKEGGRERVRSLPVNRSAGRMAGWSMMDLPEFAADIAPQGRSGLLVPIWADHKHCDWKNYDWWRAAEYFLNSHYEREYERDHGPVHSYAGRLEPEVSICFDHAWVNRILLFLRRWWAHHHKQDEMDVFGPTPAPKIHLTHDVDAVSKTLAIRLKQAAFCTYNKRFKAAYRFLFGAADYWQFETILAMESDFDRTSLWNFYGGQGGWLRTPKDNLFDPSYNVSQERLAELMRHLIAQGHQIGLHQAYDSWMDPNRMRQEKTHLESVIGQDVTECRQHWLRFSFDRTWTAQAQAGLRQDMTLGFNDRPGFRNAAALPFTVCKGALSVIPMVLMDSHLYDYHQLDQTEREAMIDRMLIELKETGGEASVIWHHRVFHSDYGWGEGYRYLLNRLDELGFEKS